MKVKRFFLWLMVWICIISSVGCLGNGSSSDDSSSGSGAGVSGSGK